MFGSSLPPVVSGGSCFVYVIYICLRVVVCDMYCVVFLFCSFSSCVPYVARFSEISICDFPFRVFSEVYLYVCSLSIQTPLIDCSLRCSNKRICVYLEYILMFSFSNNILFFMTCWKLSFTFIEHRILHTRSKRAGLSCSITGNIIDRSVGFGNRFYPSHFCVSPNKSSYLI